MNDTVRVVGKPAVPEIATDTKLVKHLGHLSEDARGLFIVVEANIGAGKSTLCSILKNIREEYDGETELLLEPVGKPRFKRLLELYYQNPARWGFTFQMYVLNERFRQHTYAAEMAMSGRHVIQDRSIFADGCFGTTVFEDGNMSEDEWSIYAETFGSMKRYLRYPDVMVYLRTDPAVCYERLKRRGRKAEAGIPLDYLKRIHDKHEEMVQEMSRYTRVLRVDWDHFGAAAEDINRQINEVAAEDRRFLRDYNRI